MNDLRFHGLTMRKKLGDSLGEKVILLYLLQAYFLPGLALLALGFESIIYRAPPLSPLQVMYGVMLFVVVILTAVVRTPHIHAVLPMKVPPFWLLAGILVVLLTWVGIGYRNGLSGWRYSNTGISDNLSSVVLIYVVGPSIFSIMLFLEIFCFPDVPGKRLERRIIISAIAVGLALTASGIGPTIEVALAVLYAIFPSQFRILIFKGYKPPSADSRLAKLGVIPLIIAGIAGIAIAVVIGDAIKSGQDTDVSANYWSDLSFFEYLGYLAERFSTAWISLRVSLFEYTTASWDAVSQNLWAPIGNFLFRFDTLTGNHFGFTRPYVGSIMRLNYELINVLPINEREGTSPGMIGGFVDCFPLPFSFLMLAGYTLIIRAVMNALSLSFAGIVSWGGAVLVLYFVFEVFASPIDYFLIIDNGFMIFAIYAALAIYAHVRLKRGMQLVAAR